jgi:hypothetical protein
MLGVRQIDDLWGNARGGLDVGALVGADRGGNSTIEMGQGRTLYRPIILSARYRAKPRNPQTAKKERHALSRRRHFNATVWGSMLDGSYR